MVTLFATGIAQVLLLGLVIGAGLPAVFALGIRFMAIGTGGDAEVSHARARPLGRIAGILCFAFVVAAVAFGITVIVASGFGYAVSFEHLVPTLREK